MNGNAATSPSRSAEDHRGQVGAQDLRLGELGPAGEVVLAVQADADAVGGTPAAALALVGRGLRDGLDGQALYLGPVAGGRSGRARSTTYLMPGTVSEVSALVASTTRRPLWGRNTRCWSAAASRAYSGRTSTPPGLLGKA